MNCVSLMGRLTKDVEVRYSNNSTAIAKFSIAVNRQFKKEGEERQADFLNCVAFGHTANHIAKYFSKGSMISLLGRLQTGSYEKDDGTKVYTTDVIVDSCFFCGGKNESSQGQSATTDNTTSPGFFPMDDSGDELPF